MKTLGAVAMMLMGATDVAAECLPRVKALTARSWTHKVGPLPVPVRVMTGYTGTVAFSRVGPGGVNYVVVWDTALTTGGLRVAGSTQWQRPLSHVQEDGVPESATEALPAVCVDE